uniref:WGS project CAEQ00000000 data, annotated contig 984 n=1 Tax=Trypanosoma congolense (strain IL3000) TaxID=1068625 RepID=F9WK37_TRYCI|nr:unnamed protein product [Trypanosoma congolense IL3000]
MEKYRKFGDASTGINPFISMQTPTTISMVVSAFVFPLRCVFAVGFVLLLLVVDAFAYLFFVVPGLSFVSHQLIAKLQRLLVRCLLFGLGNICVVQGDTPRLVAPSAGDVVVANLQSVWDMFVIEVAGRLPLFVVAFYAGGAVPPRSTGKKEVGSLIVMEPSPLQRWRVWWHIYNTGSLAFLRAAASGDGGTVPLDVTALQKRYRRLGVPLVLFAEGTCSNGKGVLSTSPLVVGAPPARMVASAVDYDTAALHTVVRPRNVFVHLFSMSASLYGSRDPAWYSPQFPTATVRLAAVTLNTSSGAAEDTVMVDSVKFRQTLCGVSRSRRVLGVGLRDKCGFVEAFVAR